MTEPTHTPGPWHISGSVFVGDSPFPAVRDHLGLVVCDVLDDGKSEPETLANAKLIAAAPDLLDAAIIGFAYMQTMLAQVANLAPDDPKVRGAVAEKEKVMAAIAKATGGA